MSTIAERLAGFAAALRERPSQIPQDVQDRAGERLLDNLGCILLGWRVQPARIIADIAMEAGQGHCRLVGRDMATSASAAAFSQGVLAQAFEMNDLGVYTHPGACVVPAALAAAGHVEQTVDGRQLIAAIVAGYEVTIRISEAIGPAAELDVGWHTPGFHGAIGAATAAAMVLGLDEPGIAQAIVMAADLAGGGLMMARLGSDMKRVHCGRAAETGITCAIYAQRGLRSRLDTFENEHWGYCRTITASADRFDLDSICNELGSRFVGFSRTAVKYFPVGAEIQGMIDNVNALKLRSRFELDDILRIDVGTPHFFVKAECHGVPNSVTDTHFNSSYGVAMALRHTIKPVYQSSDVLRLWAGGFHDPLVRSLAAKVRHCTDAELEARNPYSVDSRVSITLADGRTLSAMTDYVRSAESAGTMKFAPMDRSRILGKFRAIAGSLSSAQCQKIEELALGFSDIPDVKALFELAGSLSTP